MQLLVWRTGRGVHLGRLLACTMCALACLLVRKEHCGAETH
jgi:hypothetical protein